MSYEPGDRVEVKDPTTGEWLPGTFVRYEASVYGFKRACPYDVEVDEPKDIVWNGRVVSTRRFQADAEHIRRSLSPAPAPAVPVGAVAVATMSPRVVAVAKVLHSMGTSTSWVKCQELAKELIAALEVRP